MNKQILFYGDSHIYALREIKLPGFVLDENLHVIKSSAASARGLRNSNSKLQTANKLISKLTNDDYDHILLGFGKVDIDFVYYYIKSNNMAYSFEEHVVNTVDKYMEFLINSLNFIEKEKITILGIHLPTLGSSRFRVVLLGEKAISNVVADTNVLLPSNGFDLIPNLVDRTQMALKFNEYLQRKAIEFGYGYLDISEESFSKVTKMVKASFVNKLDIHDHHLDNFVAGKAWENKLMVYLNDKNLLDVN